MRQPSWKGLTKQMRQGSLEGLVKQMSQLSSDSWQSKQGNHAHNSGKMWTGSWRQRRSGLQLFRKYLAFLKAVETILMNLDHSEYIQASCSVRWFLWRNPCAILSPAQHSFCFLTASWKLLLTVLIHPICAFKPADVLAKKGLVHSENSLIWIAPYTMHQIG